MSRSAEWSWTAPDGSELRIMMLPDRKSLYAVLVDEEGMRQVAKTMGDREATALVKWLDMVIGDKS
jgi:hypothetical protein